MSQIILKNGNIVDPQANKIYKGDIFISATHHVGVIKGNMPLNTKHAKEHWQEIDCEGLWVVPGLVDMHAHARTPGPEQKETLTTISMAALAGGFTSVVAMANTSPAIDNPEVLNQLLIRAERESLVDFFQVAAATVGRKGLELSAMSLLAEMGAIAFSDDGDGIQNPEVLQLVIKSAQEAYRPILLHCQDKRFDTYDRRAEIHDVSLAIRIAESCQAPIHIQHVSCAESVQLIREAKARGVKVTCETAPHYLALTQSDFRRIGPNAKMNPPLRTEKDRQAVIAGLVDGTIDAIATDHAPHSKIEKEGENPPFGIIGLETAVPVVFSHLSRWLTVPQIIAKMTINPAKILGLEQRGLIKEGWPADVTIIDPLKRKVLKAEDLKSKSHNSPWLKKRMQTWPVMTIHNGKIMMRDGEIILE